MTSISRDRLFDLFEVRARVARFETLEDELSAVEKGHKGISAFPFVTENLESSEDYIALLEEAANRNLFLVTVTYRDAPTTHVLIVHPDHTWRVPAYKLLNDVGRLHVHSEGFEHLESALLGYSSSDTTAWLAERRLRTAGEAGVTVFVLLTSADLTELDRQGRRSLRPAIGGRMLAFYNRDVGISGSSVLRPDFSASLPKQTKLCRCALSLPSWKVLFNSSTNSDDQILLSYIDDNNIGPVNAGLLSAIEILG